MQQTDRRASVQDVEARLWQDPLGAVTNARAALLKNADDRKHDEQAHSLKNFADMLQRQVQADGQAIVLAVMLSSGPYAEQIESRRRTRHAVLAGLSARGFVPLDNEHLGYFYREGAPTPEILPYERFEYGFEGTRSQDFKGARLTVLWLDSSDYFDGPLKKLVSLAAGVSPRGAAGKTSPVHWRVLGPSSSDGLRVMVLEAAEPAFDRHALGAFNMRFFSGAATVADDAMLRKPTGSTLQLPDPDQRRSVGEWFGERGVVLTRTIGTDDKLGKALLNELQLRGLKARQTAPNEEDACDPAAQDRPSAIAIVSELDTLYGRTLRRQFRATKDHPGFCATRWQYVRGLDGRLPGDAATPSADGHAKKDGKSAGADALGEGSYLERPEGQSQYDYLRRLASRIREEDATLRRRHGPEGGILAVGVLGNDVYDKLLVLQALQTEIPHAIFFTTDLDARLFHPREQAWARNLIVASSFGLRLADPLQRSHAPFRDSYQTSAFLATQLALADVAGKISPETFKVVPSQGDVSRWIATPRIFEVSRSGFFDFSGLQEPNPALCRNSAMESCKSIHPDGSAMVPHASPVAVFIVAAALSLLLWVPALVISRRGRRRLRQFIAAGGHSSAARMARGGTLLILGLLLAIVPALVFAHFWPDLAESMTRDGKPLSFIDGISPWPTYLIRLGTLVLCLYLAARAWSALRMNTDEIAREFRLGATRRHFREEVQAEQRRLKRRERLAAMLSVRFYRDRPGLLRAMPDMTPRAISFWKHYLVQNQPVSRVIRTVLCMAVMTLLALLIVSAVDDAPTSPLRGPLTQTMQTLTTLPASLAVQFLIFFVADATLLCVFFLRGLRLHRSNWPERTLQSFHLATGVPVEYLDNWIDLQFIARRTHVIGRLVYYPFVALSLMLLARSSFFDDWYAPSGTYLVAGLSFLIVLTCALALRLTAEESRAQAIEHTGNAILRAKGKGDAALASQLQMLCDRMQEMSEGAFAPYSRQPLLKAVLLPLLTFGGSSLFDYLALLNL